MRYLAILLSVAVVALVAVGTSVGAQAQHVNLIIDDTFQSDFLSDTCGVDVFIDVVADLNATLVYNKSGLIVREIDPAGPGTVTVRSPDTGKSFSYPFRGAQWDYGSGAVVGSDVIGSFTGVSVRVTGFLPPDAGLFRFEGFVEGFDENGVPIVPIVEVIADRGNREDGAVVAAICAALNP